MIKDIEDKKVNMVIVKDTSRLGRDYISFGEYIEKYFPEHQVRLSPWSSSSLDNLQYKAQLYTFVLLTSNLSSFSFSKFHL